MNSELGLHREALLEVTLHQRILSMRMAPGSELALCNEFGLSRPPVRELMHQLAGQGLIDREANRSAKVAALSIQAQARSLALSDMHNLADVYGRVFTAIELHESLTAALAARQLSMLLRQRIHDYLTRQHH